MDASSSAVAKADGEARPRVQSAARAIAILLAVAASDNGLTTKEISEQVGIGRQATYHLLHTLVEAGVLTRADGRRYLLGLRVGALAEGFTRQLSPGERLSPIVRELAQSTGETAYATSWWSDEITTLVVVQGTNPVRAAEVPQGSMGNAHARASGKLLLAYADPVVRRRYLDAHDRPALTAHTKTELVDLEADFERILELGYAEDMEEYAAGLCCLSVPIDFLGSPVALSIAVPRGRFEERRDRYLAELLDAARSGARTAED
ncbi:MAG: IclR family transcriptional regulator [Actinobacteria bacterium]|nr:IclR family transcriptional regulator [Actinomycetota bacterium]